MLGTEDVDGTPCYVIEIMPNMEALFKWLAEQQSGTMKDIDPKGFELAQMFKRMSVKEWIARDSYLVMKLELDVLAEIPGNPDKEAEKVTVSSNANVRFYDYNQPISIVLPADAANASEIPAS